MLLLSFVVMVIATFQKIIIFTKQYYLSLTKLITSIRIFTAAKRTACDESCVGNSPLSTVDSLLMFDVAVVDVVDVVVVIVAVVVVVVVVIVVVDEPADVSTK